MERRVTRGRRTRADALALLLTTLLLFAGFFAGLSGAGAAASLRPVPRTTLPGRGAAPSGSAAGRWAALSPAPARLAPQVSADVDVSDAVYPQSETAVAIDPQNPSVLLAGSNDIGPSGGMDAYVSSNGGSTWQRTLLPASDAAGEGGTGSFDSDPSVGFDAAGDMYYSFILVDAAGTAASVVVSRSTDGGASWSPATVVSDGIRQGLFDDKPYLAVDDWAGSPHEGNVYVTWTTNNGNQTQVISLATSTDGGQTWSAPVSVSAPGDVLFSEPRVAPDGSVYVIWDDYGSRYQQQQSVETIARCASFSNGQVSACGTPVPLAVSNVNLEPLSTGPYTGAGACSGLAGSVPCYAIPAQPDRGIGSVPSLAVDAGGNLYAAWTDAPQPKAASTEIMFSRSTDQGATWSAPVRISDDSATSDYDFLPWLAVDPATGTLVATFYSTRNDPTNHEQADVYMTESTDGGQTWTPNERVTSVSSDEGPNAPYAVNANNYGDYEGVAAYGGQAEAVWTDTRDEASLQEETYGAGIALSTAHTVTVGVSPTPVYTGASQTVTGAVYDAAGNPVANAMVQLSSSPSVAFSPATPTTDSAGAYSATFAAPAAPGPMTVTASVYGASPAVTGSATFTVVTGGLTLAAPPYEVAGNSAITVSGQATDPSGTPLANAQVSLSATAGTIPATATTDANGDFSVAYTAPAAVGPVTITGTVSGGSPETGSTIVFVTGANTTVSAADSGSSNGSAPAQASVGGGGGLSASAGGGAGAVSVVQYTSGAAPGDAGSPTFTSTGVYFDVSLSQGNGFSSVTVTQCDLGGGDSVWWWNALATTPAWTAVSPQAYGNGCVTIGPLNATSSPTLAQLTGTVFAASAPPSGGGGVGGFGAPPATGAPAVTGVNPDSGPAAGGTAVTITGSHFTGATQVSFGGVAAAGYSVDSDTQITATSPPGSGTVDVTVTTAAGTSAANFGDRFTYAAPPPQQQPQQQPAAQAPGATFSDVPAGYWAAPYIEQLAGAGVIDGFPDGTFRPGDPVTRAQFVKMLALATGLRPAAGATPFADVAASDWYAPYVAAALRAGLIQGVAPDAFAPSSPITREQMAVMVARALAAAARARPLPQSAAAAFRDLPGVDAWAQQDVQMVARLGIMNGFPDGGFHPLDETTRAQAAAVLARTINLLKSVSSSAPSSSGGSSQGS
jgi:hypothetical protein